MDSVDAGIFEAWLASTDDGVVAVDAEERVVLHNPAASRVTGLPPATARRRPWREVLRLDSSVSDLLWSAAASGRPAGTLASVLCAQGNLRTAETHAHPWTDAEGRTGVLILIRDLTVLCRNRSGPGGRNGYGGMVGADPVMAALYDLVEAIAPSDAPTVIEGEEGTGKELAAQTIHARSRRAERPLVVVDCGASVASLLEAELFGRARVAPHGTATIGRAELAHSGTLLLRRVGALPAAVQARLLRLLDTGLVERPGESVPRRVDVRILATSQRPLEELLREGRFNQHPSTDSRWSGYACPACASARETSRSSPSTSWRGSGLRAPCSRQPLRPSSKPPSGRGMCGSWSMPCASWPRGCRIALRPSSRSSCRRS
jgi:PAS domain S-box-containing protein